MSGRQRETGGDGESLDVVVTIQHPAHVHFFRNAIEELETNGHDVHVFAREKDIAVDLLEAYDVDYELLAGEAASLPGKAAIQVQYELQLLRRAREIDPDVMMAIGEPGVVHVSKLLGCRGIIFTDTEHATYRKRFVYPLADRVCSPEFYQDDIGDNHVRYPGYHELAYLHPDRFEPDPSVLDDVEADPDDQIAVVRLVSWDAAHDIGDAGVDDAFELVERLEAAGAHVIVTSESELPPELADRELSIPPHRVHDLLYYADLFVGESATMATEGAVLGTPGVLISTFEGIGNVRELRDEYGLVFSYSGEQRHERGLRRAVSILEEDDPDKWQRRRQRLLEDKIDTTDFLTTLVETGRVDREAVRTRRTPEMSGS